MGKSRRLLGHTVCALSLALLAQPGAAQVLTFDDIGGSGQVPDGYGGLDWTNFYYHNGDTYNGGLSGYNYGSVSGSYVAYNGYGSNAIVMSSSDPFSLTSGYFAGAWNNGLTIQVLGYGAGNALLYSTSFVVNSTGPTLTNFGWSGLTSVQFSSFGGTSAGYPNGSGNHFVMDNLSVGFGAVPEPATWAMMLIGFGALGHTIRRKKRLSTGLVAA